MVNPLLNRMRGCWLALALPLAALLASCQMPATPEATVIASPNDSREYRYLELPNQLRVLLVSDPATDKAAAALDVGVGSRQDPADRAGLAHFLEHMLFLGTDRFPEAGEYQSFITAHGGSHNAYTAFENTNYFFDIDAQYLAPALDRFSRFFVAPLFTEQYVEREKKAVNSEYLANIREDQRRLLDVLKTVVNPQHPFAGFSVGSLETLADRPDHPVRDDLLAFYRQHYSANQMTLVVIGREPLDELQGLVTSRFSDVPDHQREQPPIATPLFAPDLLPAFLQVQPVQQQRTLTYGWPIPDTRADYRGKSLEYIGNILGHEGKGSLLSFLKAKGWAQALSAGQGLEYHGGGMFNVSIELTEAGANHVDDISLALYQAINRIREGGVQEWLYREQQVVAEQRFRFREQSSPIREASRLASNLHDYPPAEVLRGDYLMEQFDAARIDALLAQLTPQRALVTLMAPQAKVDRKSPYYQVPYGIAPQLAPTTARLAAAGLDDAIRLPEPNIFIATELALKPLAGNATKPALLESGGGLELWFLQDPVFRLPKATVAVNLLSPRASDGPRDVVLTELLVRLVREDLNEFSYPAYLAGLSYSIDRHGRGVSLQVEGFSDKQAVLLERMLVALKAPSFTAQQFERVRWEYRRQLEDDAKRPPYNLLIDDLPDVLYRRRWPESELARLVNAVTPAQVRAFSGELLAAVDIEMLVHGNYLEADARQLGSLVSNALLADARPVTPPAVEIVRLPAERELRRRVATIHDDASLLWYRQAADTEKSTRAALGVSAQLLNADFYTRLRTEQQLGYIVMSTVYPLREVPGLVFLVQSPVAGPEKLAAAYSEFLRDWAGRGEAELQPLFERHRQALAKRLQEAPKNLGEASDRLWQDLNNGYLGFDSRQQLAAAVQGLTFEQWLACFRRDVLADGGRALWLSVDGRFGADALKRGQPLGELGQFKAEQQFYRFP